MGFAMQGISPRLVPACVYMAMAVTLVAITFLDWPSASGTADTDMPTDGKPPSYTLPRFDRDHWSKD